MGSLNSTERLLAATEQGATILTANARTQRWLHRLYDERQRQRQATAWPTPAILSWGAWLETLWQEYVLLSARPPLKLSSVQELALWERIVAESDAGRQMMATHSSAELAHEAWRLLHEYCVTDRSQMDATVDGAVFRTWAESFERLCRDQNWIDSARVPDKLSLAISEGRVSVSGPLHLTGFDRITPQQKRLLQTLQDNGCECDVVELQDGATADSCLLTLNDCNSEILSAAGWARARMTENPAASVGVVVPDLQGVRSRVQRLFTEVLAPDALLGGTEARLAFELSLGRPISSCPIVHAALQLLRWLHAPLPIDNAGSLVRSVYLRGGIEEASCRALLDVAMRRQCSPEVSIAEVQQLAAQRNPDGSPRPHSCRVLESVLRSSVRQCDSRPKPPSAWSRQFTEVLQTAGWPGERRLDSADYQTWQAWLELLKSFGTLDVALPSLSAADAISHLARCAAREVFEPENIGAPIQVLGPLEASGSRFAHLWVMGLDDERWPARASTNPLLPPVLQRRYGMPHASAADDLDFARRVTARLRRSAGEVVFSCPRMDGERALRPSPLLADLPRRELGEVLPDPPATWVGELNGSAEVEPLRGASPLQYQHGDARGGSKVFQLQAACPFRAFAELQLAAEEMQNPAPGLDASERGQLVHLVLQYVWEQLESQSELRALTPDSLRQLVTCCVDEALKRHKIGVDGPWSSRFAEIERGRLTTIVCAWLELEKARAPFRVLEREQKKELEIGGVRVSVRVDRVDELEMGGKVVLDYKTGAAKGGIEQAWDGERPDEPQLPLYAVAEEDRLAGLAFAHVRAGEHRFRGQSDALGVFPGVKPLVEQTLRDKVEQWRESLAALGAQFLAGEVAVNPKKAETCRWCATGPLCRRFEAASTADVMEDGDATDL